MKMIEKWRNDNKKMKHYDLIKLIIDGLDIPQCLKIKKI